MADLSTVTLPVLPLTTGVVLPGMVVTVALETDRGPGRGRGRRRRRAPAARPPGRGALRLGRRHRPHRVHRARCPNGTSALVIRAINRARVGAGVVGAGEALWLKADPVDEGEPTDARPRAGPRAAGRPASHRSSTSAAAASTDLLAGIDEPGALADTAGWWPDLSIERKVELLETIDVDRAGREGPGLGQGGAGRARADRAHPQRRLRRHGEDPARVPAAPADGGHPQGAGRRRAARSRRRLPRRGSPRSPTSCPTASATAIEKRDRQARAHAPQNTEHGWIRTWLDTVLELPWGDAHRRPPRPGRCPAVLDADHTGLDEVKDRIVEYLAVRRLRAERGLDSADAAEGDAVATTASRSPTRRSPAVTAAGTAPSSRWSGPPASARPASASPSPAPSAASSSGSPSAACATRPRSAATAAPTSAPSPAASCGR